MKLTKDNIAKRLRNWKTWVALFSLAGLIVTHYNLLHWKSELDFWQEIVFAIGVLFGFWTDHETKGEGVQ